MHFNTFFSALLCLFFVVIRSHAQSTYNTSTAPNSTDTITTSFLVLKTDVTAASLFNGTTNLTEIATGIADATDGTFGPMSYSFESNLTTCPNYSSPTTSNANIIPCYEGVGLLPVVSEAVFLPEQLLSFQKAIDNNAPFNSVIYGFLGNLSSGLAAANSVAACYRVYDESIGEVILNAVGVYVSRVNGTQPNIMILDSEGQYAMTSNLSEVWASCATTDFAAYNISASPSVSSNSSMPSASASSTSGAESNYAMLQAMLTLVAASVVLAIL